jgi:UDP-glucose 4-epimerase
MRVLLTGSSGWLGRTPVPRLRRDGRHVVGLDVVPGAGTTHLGSITDRALIDRIMAEERITAIVIAGALTAFRC